MTDLIGHKDAVAKARLAQLLGHLRCNGTAFERSYHDLSHSIFLQGAQPINRAGSWSLCNRLALAGLLAAFWLWSFMTSVQVRIDRVTGRLKSRQCGCPLERCSFRPHWAAQPQASLREGARKAYCCLDGPSVRSRTALSPAGFKHRRANVERRGPPGRTRPVSVRI